MVGIVIGIVGLCAVLATGVVVAVRPAAAADGSGTWSMVRRVGGGRLRLARAGLAGTLGPLGAFVTLLGGGLLVVTCVVALFGLGVAALEHPVDWWAFHLAGRLRVDGWARLMRVVTRMGDLTETRIAGVAAAVLLALAYRRRWAPAVVILGVAVVEKYQQSLLGSIVDRGHPPTTLGTFPSGGCARLISVYGVILFLVLEAARAGRRARVAAWTILSAAAFAEGYSRWYLDKHWLTDVLGGWFYGVLLLAVAIFASRALTDPGHETTPVAPGDGTVGTIRGDFSTYVALEAQQYDPKETSTPPPPLSL